MDKFGSSGLVLEIVKNYNFSRELFLGKKKLVESGGWFSSKSKKLENLKMFVNQREIPFVVRNINETKDFFNQRKSLISFVKSSQGNVFYKNLIEVIENINLYLQEYLRIIILQGSCESYEVFIQLYQKEIDLQDRVKMELTPYLMREAKCFEGNRNVLNSFSNFTDSSRGVSFLIGLFLISFVGFSNGACSMNPAQGSALEPVKSEVSMPVFDTKGNVSLEKQIVSVEDDKVVGIQNDSDLANVNDEVLNEDMSDEEEFVLKQDVPQAPAGYVYWKSVRAKVTYYTPKGKGLMQGNDKTAGKGVTSTGKSAYIYDGVAVAPPKLRKLYETKKWVTDEMLSNYEDYAIPYGAMVHIPGKGFKVADDTGGGMRQSALGAVIKKKGKVQKIIKKIPSFHFDVRVPNLKTAAKMAKKYGDDMKIVHLFLPENEVQRYVSN